MYMHVRACMHFEIGSTHLFLDYSHRVCSIQDSVEKRRLFDVLTNAKASANESTIYT